MSNLITQFANDNSYFFGTYNLTNKITITFPTIREILLYGEQKFFSLISALTSTASDLIAELDDKGIDWEEADDFIIFVSRFMFLDGLNILVNLNPSEFEIKYKDEKQEDIVLYNKKNDITIDKNVYNYLADYIRKAFGLEKNVIKAGNEYTKKALIEVAKKERKKALRNQGRYTSQLKAKCSYVANCYHCSINDILDMRIDYLFDCVKRLNAINEAQIMPFLIYYGMVDGKKTNVYQALNPMRDL